MSLFDRVTAAPRTFFSEVFRESNDGQYREHPLDLPEKMALRSINSGADLSKHAEVERLSNFKAKKPEFVKLADQGFVKHAAVFRSGEKAAQTKAAATAKAADAALTKKQRKARKAADGEQNPEQGGYGGRSVSIHYWEHPDGRRVKPKFTNDSPGQPADRP